jgi:hypothetical protein
MHYWTQRSAGMMTRHARRGGSESYSVENSVGPYECGAGGLGSGHGVVPWG